MLFTPAAFHTLLFTNAEHPVTGPAPVLPAAGNGRQSAGRPGPGRGGPSRALRTSPVVKAQCGNEAKRAVGILTALAAAALVALAVATVGARSGLGHVIVERPDLARVEAALTQRIAGIICASSPADVGILRVFAALHVVIACLRAAPPDDVATLVVDSIVRRPPLRVNVVLVAAFLTARFQICASRQGTVAALTAPQFSRPGTAQQASPQYAISFSFWP